MTKEKNNIIQNVFENGTYYNPAWKHYEKICYVTCDKCLKENISVCIGLNDNDLCMECVSELAKNLPVCLFTNNQ
jgi:hypothetical protein